MRQHIFGLAVGLAILLAACQSATSTPNAADTPEMASSTSMAGPSATSTSTVTPLPSPSVTPSPVPTELPVRLVLLSNAVCRSGPGRFYPVIEYLLLGDTAIAHGKAEVTWENEDENIWFIIDDPNQEGSCWISETVVSVEGNVDSLEFSEIPPTPQILPSSTVELHGVVYYLISLGTGGPVACGDSLISIQTGIRRTGNLEEDIKNALNGLLTLRQEYAFGLYNALYQSRLKAKSVTVSNGTATVYLAGTVVKPQDDCDKERYRMQVFTTVRAFEGIDRAIVWANNVLLGDLLEQGNK
ncbi:MAG: hypothetical protein OEZ02_08540 [Anaerolineae bacterium]|nr:hypothetical protein [Anaerolineae bacterium]